MDWSTIGTIVSIIALLLMLILEGRRLYQIIKGLFVYCKGLKNYPRKKTFEHYDKLYLEYLDDKIIFITKVIAHGFYCFIASILLLYIAIAYHSGWIIMMQMGKEFYRNHSNLIYLNLGRYVAAGIWLYFTTRFFVHILLWAAFIDLAKNEPLKPPLIPAGLPVKQPLQKARKPRANRKAQEK